MLLASLAPPAFARGGRGGGRAGGGARMSAPRSPAPRTTNAGNRQQNRQTNAGNRQQNRQTNAGNRQQKRQTNAGNRQQNRYAYGGRAYYSRHAYGYHRYRPYAWGAGFRPVGFFAATLAASAVAVTIANHHYWYDAGIWYGPASGGYTVVTAPVGATVAVLPTDAVVVESNTYYYGGAYYEKTGDQYQVVAPAPGTVVEHLPEGGEEVTVGDRKYVKIGETYYQPINEDGKEMYEVVEVKPENAGGA